MTLPSTGIFDGGAAGGGGGGTFTATISSNQQEMNLATWATGQGWDGTSYAEITVAAGVYVWSDDNTIPGMTTGAFPGGLKLIVEGYIIGKGGDSSTDALPNGEGLPGGPALSLGTSITIEGGVSGYIAGGGGGGSGVVGSARFTGGGGAGGGKAGDNDGVSGGSGGSPGAAGDDGMEQESGNKGFGGGSGGGGASVS
ncbi:hypothetical protein [Roseovarius ramblicola]|uniref:PE-PGRS family protein n=1 Tax=Roseovarius ramblicola TaxID=2022336 RepID=A0ABV5I678_9RHOB